MPDIVLDAGDTSMNATSPLYSQKVPSLLRELWKSMDNGGQREKQHNDGVSRTFQRPSPESQMLLMAEEKPSHLSKKKKKI